MFEPGVILDVALKYLLLPLFTWILLSALS